MYEHIVVRCRKSFVNLLLMSFTFSANAVCTQCIVSMSDTACKAGKKRHKTEKRLAHPEAQAKRTKLH